MALNFANNNSLSAITALPASISGGGLNLISTQTASSSANLSFTSGIDSTYKQYIFKFINIHPATDDANFTYQFSIDGGSNYNTTITSTAFNAQHREDGGDSALSYQAGSDLAQSTSFNPIKSVGGDNDQSLSGTAILFDPSNTTFAKHFLFRTNHSTGANYSNDQFEAGYVNSTSAVNAVQFKMSSGNIDSGVIKLYGVS